MLTLRHAHPVRCSHGVCILPDARYLSRVPAEFQAAASEDGNGGADVLVVPGGAIGAMILKTNEAVQELVGQFRDNGKWVTAICGGTLSLVTSQLAAAAAASASTTGSPVPVPVPDSARPGRVTGYPSTRAEIVDVRWEYAHESERVVVDGRLITSQGCVALFLCSCSCFVPLGLV